MPADIIHTPPTLDLPNFDGMTTTELWEFWVQWHIATQAKATTLVGVRENAAKLAHTLANYACNKACAMRCRLDGDIVQAINYETICDRIYQTLPEDLRW
jgi:hypothetical protein